MRRDLITSVLAVIVLTLLLGLAYPLVVTGIAQVAFHGKANGEQVRVNGRLVGSKLIGQDFHGLRRYFQERPSTATSYNAAGSSFTNLGPNSKKARDTYAGSLRAYLARERPFNPALRASGVPVDAVTSSASGVDPQISQANAAIQAHRIAAVRRLPLALVQKLIKQNTSGRFLGVLGEPGVNVLGLNLALDGTAR
jgi:potassium-transporting ATPase KdpC subunit